MRRVQVRGWIDDPLSLTELHLTFENPHDQVLDVGDGPVVARDVRGILRREP